MTFKIEYLEFKFIFGDRKELIIENFDKNENISIGLKNCKFQKPGSGLNYK